MSPISGGNDSRKRHEKRLIFKIETIHPQGLTNDFLLFDHIPSYSFRFCLARADNSVDFPPLHSIVYVHPPPTYSIHFAPPHRLLIDFKNSK